MSECADHDQLPSPSTSHKKKNGTFVYQSRIETPPKNLLPPSPERGIKRGRGGVGGVGAWEGQLRSQSSMQHPPTGYTLGRAPLLTPYFTKPGAGQYKVGIEEKLSQLAKAVDAKGRLVGGAWDNSISYHANAANVLNTIASSLLEDEAADLSDLGKDTGSSSGRRQGGGRRAAGAIRKGTPQQLQPLTAFVRPLVWVRETATDSASTSNSVPAPQFISGPCMFIDQTKITALPGRRTGLWDGQLGYANMLLGSFPAGQGISEGVHRLVKEFIFGPAPAVKIRRGGRVPPYPKGGYWVCCHTCGNKSCLNPLHLVWGSEGENKRDELAVYKRLAREQGHPEWSLPP